MNDTPTFGDQLAAADGPQPVTPVAPLPPPAAPTNATEALARLETLKADPVWRDKFLAGNGPQGKEWRELNDMVATAADNPVEAALAGIMEDAPFQKSGHLEMVAATGMFREMGIGDGVIREALDENFEVTQTEHDLVAKWKASHLRDHDWQKRFLAGDGDAVRDMMTANIVLTRNIKKSAA